MAAVVHECRGPVMSRRQWFAVPLSSRLMPAILELSVLKLKDCKFKASLSYK